MLSTPANEYPEFPAALSFLPSLSPADATAALTNRIARLDERLAALDDEITGGGTFLPPVFLVESTYQRQVFAAQRDFVQRLVDDLRIERITWPSVS